jgi:hypothetical protein
MTSRRQFDLGRWTADDTFVQLHDTVVIWLDRHFATIEEGAPWLDRIGVDTWDYCRATVRPRLEFSLGPRYRATAGCTRDVIAVYGFDGALAQRLGELSEALSAAGWRRVGPLPIRLWEDAHGEAVMKWRPSAALSHPPGMEGKAPWEKPPLDPHMWLSWSSRGQDNRLRRDPNRLRTSARNLISVEFSGTEYWNLPDTALQEHEHVLAIKLDLSYYSNPDALRRPHRIPRHILPTRPAQHR